MRVSAIVLAATVMVAWVGRPDQVLAARKVIFYQSGEDIFPVGDLPAPYDKIKELRGARAGYKCSIFGLFWAYLHIWNCQAVGVRSNQFFQHAALTQAIDAQYGQADMQVGLWKKHGRWVLLLLIVLGVFGAVSSRKKEKGEDAQPGGDEDDRAEDDDESGDDESGEDARKPQQA